MNFPALLCGLGLAFGLGGCGGSAVLPPAGAPSSNVVRPPGTEGQVQVSLVSSSPKHVWTLKSRGEVLCQTPCTRWLSPDQDYELKSTKPSLLRAWSVAELPSLEPYVAHGSARVQVEPRSSGKLVGGIVTTSVGAAGLFFGGLMALLGCTGDEEGLCTVGIVTGGAGVVAIGSGSWLMLTSRPSAELTPGGAPHAKASPQVSVAGAF